MWFEIPTKDLDRAISFYQDVFECEIKKVDLGDLKMGWFPTDGKSPGATGTLVHNEEFYENSEKAGTLIYLHAEDCSSELARVEKAGGKVVIPKKEISPEHGFMGVFIDSEGNRIALHSLK